MAKKKASEDMFNELHNLVTTEFLQRIKSGEASTQDLKAACDWLAKNDISGVAYAGSNVGAGVSLNRQASGSVTKQLCGVWLCNFKLLKSNLILRMIGKIFLPIN